MKGKKDEKELEDFPKWDELQRYISNGHKPKYKAIELYKIALKWLPYYPGNAPYGPYAWHFCVGMEQERLWNYPEFQEGRDFGHNPTGQLRDANPYKEHSRNRSWDCGYILGLYEKRKNRTDVYGR